MKFFYASALILTALLGSLAFAQATNLDLPVVVSASSPVYPANALAVRASGDVLVDVDIDANGKVSSARVIKGHPLLRAASVAAAQRWRFVSTTNSGNKRTAQLTFTFNLMLEKTSKLDRTPIFFPPYRIEVRDEEVEIEHYSAH